MTLALTLDGAFFVDAERPALDTLAAHNSAGRITLYSSALSYDASHQPIGLITHTMNNKSTITIDTNLRENVP